MLSCDCIRKSQGKDSQALNQHYPAQDHFRFKTMQVQSASLGEPGTCKQSKIPRQRGWRGSTEDCRGEEGEEAGWQAGSKRWRKGVMKMPLCGARKMSQQVKALAVQA